MGLRGTAIASTSDRDASTLACTSVSDDAAWQEPQLPFNSVQFRSPTVYMRCCLDGTCVRSDTKHMIERASLRPGLQPASIAYF